MKTSIGDRIKNNYENRYRFKLTRRTPVIIRLDGKAFHTLTNKCQRPFDIDFNHCMVNTMQWLLKEIQGAKCGYQQSDEISILLTDFDTLQTDAWFDYNIQKMTSVSAGIASTHFTYLFCKGANTAIFDSRVFNIPKEEVCNYFIWRQKDWIRNSVQMLGRVHFSHKELHKKSNSDVHEMLHTKGINWANLAPHWKNGTFIYKTETGFKIDTETIFTESRNIVEQYMRWE